MAIHLAQTNFQSETLDKGDLEQGLMAIENTKMIVENDELLGITGEGAHQFG